MAGRSPETTEKDVDILEARHIFLLMKKEYRISRSIRMQWFLEHLNKTVTVLSIPEQCENSADLHPVPEAELKVLSVVPHEQPPEWKPESSHLYKYLVTPHSVLLFLAHNYCMVYCLDMSPSLSAVDIQHGEVMIDGVFSSLRKSLDGLTKPFRIPGSMLVFQPEIYVTVIAHTPFFTTPAQQVLVQGWHVTQENLAAFLKNVQQQLEKLENTVAEVAGIAYDQIEAIRAESEKLVGGLFEESSDGEMVPPPAARVPMVAPDAGFVNMLRYGMLALRLLPESSCKSLIVVTDGVVASPDVNVLDSVLAQLRSGTVSCSFLHVGSQFHPHSCAGLVPYVDLMQFVADATCGAYLNVIPDTDASMDNSMNYYHEKILLWRFQKINYGSFSVVSNLVPSSLMRHQSPVQGDKWHVSNACFYGNHEPHLLKKKQEESTLSTTLHSVLCCRLREGYTIKNINIRDSCVEVSLVLPWKNHIYINYTVSCQWPPSPTCESGSSPVSVSGVSGPGLGPRVYSGSGIVHYFINIEAPYEFLHDITCLLKKPFKSQYRQAVVSRFWTTLKNLTRSDQLLVHLNSFPSNPITYTIPESIRSGMPVFYLPANSSSTLSASDMTCPQFAQFWKPVCLLEPSVWKKWLHSHRVGLVLHHDRPLPRHLHLANSSGRFQVIQCRQAAASLYSLLKDWSTFVLIENHSYVKLIHGDAEKPPTSFYIIRVTSKPPCVVINVAFLNGTPGSVRHKIVEQLKNRIGQLTFPQRPCTKETPPRKLTSKVRAAVFSSQQLQEQLQQLSQPQTQQSSPTQQQSTRKWSDVSCCVLLHKPVEKILIRYERMPSDFATVVFPDGTTPLAPGSQTKARTAGGGLLTTLSRYLHHRRWVWSAQSGADAEEEAIAHILATITKMRLQEGFSFAHSTAGIINMVLEVQMKCEIVDEEEVQPCVIQYVMFPPHTTSSNSKESGSEDEGTDEIEVPDAENDGELQIITECWIEPQHGVVVNSPPERDYMERLPYHKLADVMCRVDAECISSLLTFQHLSLMCRNARVRSPVGISPLNGIARSSPLDPIGYSPNVVTLSEQRIHYIPFAFNLMNVLPKCQQAELLFSMLIQDMSSINSLNTTADAPNKLLSDLLFEQLLLIHDQELQLTCDDCMGFLQLLHSRDREGAYYSLPIPPLQSRSFTRKAEEVEAQLGNSTTSETTVCGSASIPKWRCFLKAITSSHVVLTFVPASYSDLKLLMLAGLPLEEAHPCALKLIMMPAEKRSSQVLSHSSSCDTSCIFNKLRSDSCSPHSLDQQEVSNEPPFRTRASSWDTVTKKASLGLDRIRTGSMDSKIKARHPSLRVRDVTTDIEESKMFYDRCSLPPNPSVELNSEHADSHARKYGALKLPIYVYDCPLNVLIDVLIYRDADGNKLCKDIFQDRSFKLHSLLDFLPNCKQFEFPVKEVQGNGDDVESHSAAKHTSPEPKSEDSDGAPDMSSLSEHCKLASQAYYKVFVHSLFKSLHLNNMVHLLDVEAAVDECQEALIEIDITNFIQTVCGHLKEFCMKARVGELKHISSENSPQHEESDGDAKFPLSLLHSHAPCQPLQLLHKQIKLKFTQILTAMFRPVPSHPEYYFCVPNMGGKVQLNECEFYDKKMSEADDDNITFLSEGGEFRSEQGSTAGPTLEGQGGLLTPDDAQTSLPSNMDLESISELADDVSPLFLHLTCTVRSKGKSSSCSVRVLPTCLCELMQSLNPEETELDLEELKVTLDVLCLTLSTDIETDLLVKEKPTTKSSIPRGEEYSNLELETVGPRGSLSSDSADVHFAADPRGTLHLYRLSQLNHLPEYQLKAVLSSVEKIKWLMDDEIAAFLLDTFPLDKNTLSFVANHVARSPDRPSCLMEHVPLQFVFGPEQSLQRFLQDFRNLSVSGYHLSEEDQLYYLVRDKHSCSVSASASVSDPLMRKKSGPSLVMNLPPLYQPDMLWTTAASSECEDNVIGKKPLNNRPELEVHSDTDDDSRICSQQRTHPKLKLENGSTREAAVSKNLAECDGNQNDTSPRQCCSPSFCEVSSPQDNKFSGPGTMKRSESYGYGEKEDEKATTREISPTRWSAVRAWQRRQHHHHQHQGTPGHRSEVSSIVESALGTEDGYDGYAGDSSDSADECDWLQDLDMRRPSLPNFWLIMKVDTEAVKTYFHCRCADGEQEAPYRNVQRSVVAVMKQMCKVVNQTMLLQNLHDTRMCDQLLEPEASEDIWKSGPISSQGSDVLLSRAKSLDESQRQDGESDVQPGYLEATLRFTPGWFACNVVWEAHFILHPRLKTGPGKAGFSRGVQALRMVLNRFSVNNRKNMFVYQDNSGNVFYLRLHENVRSHSKSTPPGGLGRSDTEDNLPGPVSRSSSITSLNTRKNVTGISDECGDARPRLQSFGEREQVVQAGLSSSEGNATPCVTPQPVLPRSEDTVVLKVHGISEAGPEVKEELVQVLQNRLDDAVLEVLSLMLARNPMCKLTPEDVHFIQKPFKAPESVIQFSVQSHTLPHLQALAYYLRQNLLQFLYTPKYTDSRPECHFQDYSEPEASLKRVTEGDLFLYNQSPSSGSKGIACIAMAVVDSEGNLMQHQHYPKPSSSAYLDTLNQSEFDILTRTNSYEPECGISRGPGPVALLEFRIWKQGRVNIESLTQKLKASVRHATWDLLIEFRLLTAPLCIPSPTATSTSLPSGSSEPSTPIKAKKSVRAVDPPAQERTSDSLSVTSTKSCKLDSHESGEMGVLHEIYHATMNPWLEFGVNLSVPAVRKHSVILAVRHPLAVMVRELQNLVNLNASDTAPLAFWGYPTDGHADLEFIPGPFMGPNFSLATSPTVGVIGETISCLLIGRNLNQWKACVSEDGTFDPDILDPKNTQKVFQKFSPMLNISEEKVEFVPRQRLLFAVLSTQQVTIYTYNWSKERVENLHQQVSQLGYWLSARSSLLRSIVTQKMGLFHNQELSRKPPGSSSSSPGGLTQPAVTRSVGIKMSNPYLSNLGDMEQLVKFPVASSTSFKDSSIRRVTSSTQLGSALSWRDTFRDGKPRRPISKTPTNTDPVVCHVQQMLETRHFDRKADEQKKLYVMWQTRGATPNIPLSEDVIQLFKHNSRVIHYCLTPLLFLPRWRVQSAATRDHALSTVTVGSSLKTQHSHHSRHASGNSSQSAPSPTLRRHSEDKWHNALCANFVHEYKQYLQTLGFIPIQTEPTSPKKGEDVSRRQVQAKHQDRDDNVCYLQKSLLGGILMFEILLCEPFFHAKLHALQYSRLQTKSSSASISQFTLSFLDECDKIKILMHLHSFTYDYHLRSIHGYVSGHQPLLKQGYHLTHFLDDFLKYYSKAPNFARNLVYADVLTISEVMTPARQLFIYLLSHEKAYNMEVFRMVPIPVTTLTDLDGAECDTDSDDNEYVLVQLKSTQHVTYKDVHDMKHTDDFDATLIVAHDRDDESDQSVLHVKYYIILTSRRELYPKLEMERKLGKFCTVSTASVTSPLQLGHAGCTGELDSNGVGSGSKEPDPQAELHLQPQPPDPPDPQVEPHLQPQPPDPPNPQVEPHLQPQPPDPLDPQVKPHLQPQPPDPTQPDIYPQVQHNTDYEKGHKVSKAVKSETQNMDNETDLEAKNKTQDVQLNKNVEIPNKIDNIQHGTHLEVQNKTHNIQHETHLEAQNKTQDIQHETHLQAQNKTQDIQHETHLQAQNKTQDIQLETDLEVQNKTQDIQLETDLVAQNETQDIQHETHLEAQNKTQDIQHETDLLEVQSKTQDMQHETDLLEVKSKTQDMQHETNLHEVQSKTQDMQHETDLHEVQSKTQDMQHETDLLEVQSKTQNMQHETDLLEVQSKTQDMQHETHLEVKSKVEKKHDIHEETHETELHLKPTHELLPQNPENEAQAPELLPEEESIPENLSSEQCHNSDSKSDQVALVPTPTHHIEIRQEAVNYLGYYSSHEQLMQQLILEQADSAMRRIRSMVSQGMVDCRTHLLWNKLQCFAARDWERRRDELSPRDLMASHGLTYNEFCELRNLANVESLSQLDPRLSPLLCQPLSWYQGLAKVLMAKYVDQYRVFTAPDGNVQHIVVLHPRYVEAFMMLSLDLQSSRGDLAVVYQKPLSHREHATPESLEFCLADIQALVEGFVNACCFHLWVGLL